MSIKSSDSISETPVTLEKLQRSLESCKEVTQNILEELGALESQIDSHHGKVLAAKTSGTTATTVGTGLAVTGLIMAPFTFGTSLIVTTVGAVTSVGGATANLITDIVDRKKRNKFIENIQSLAEKQQRSKEELVTLVEDLDSAVESFMTNDGLSQMEAMYAVLNGDRCNAVRLTDSESDCSSNKSQDFEWVDNPKAWRPSVKKFCFKAGMNSFKIIKSSRALTTLATNGRTLAMSGARSANAGVIATTSTASGIGRVVGTAAFRGTMAVVGVIFTTIDIALLVKEWKALNPTKETVKAVMEEINQELLQYDELMKKLETIRNCQFFVGYFHSVPVIGSSPFAVEALLALCHQEFDKVKSIYGNSLSLPRDDPRLTVLNILHSMDLGVGPKVLESVKELLDTPRTSDEEDPPSDSTTKTFADPVVDLSTVRFPPSEEPIRIPAFNSEVITLNKSIIDEFLLHEGYPSFAHLRQYLSNSTILEDYDTPLPSNVNHTISQVSIAYSKNYCGYLNANKFEYSLTLGNLKQYTVYSLMEEVSKCSSSSSSSLECHEDEGLGCSSTTSETHEQMTDTVEVVLNHKSFIDPVALAILQKNPEQLATFENALTSVSKGYSDLQFKLPVWACDLNVALMKDAAELRH